MLFVFVYIINIYSVSKQIEGYQSPRNTSSSEKRYNSNDIDSDAPIFVDKYSNDDDSEKYFPGKSIVALDIPTHLTKPSDLFNAANIENDGNLINIEKKKKKIHKENDDNINNQSAIRGFETWNYDESMYYNNVHNKIYPKAMDHFIMPHEEFMLSPMSAPPGPGRFAVELNLSPYRTASKYALWHSKIKWNSSTKTEEMHLMREQQKMWIKQFRKKVTRMHFSDFINEKSSALTIRKFYNFGPPGTKEAAHRKLFNTTYCPVQCMYMYISTNIFICIFYYIYN